MALPLLLAGPVVRRVDARSATFWLATSEPVSVEARVWQGDQVSTAAGAVQSGAAPVAQSPATSTRRLGQRLHVAIVTATVSVGGAFPPGSLFAYDLLVSGHGGLRDLGLLAESSGATGGIHADAPTRLPLGYLPDRLPGFVSCPPTIPDLQLAHASCRKPHGLGQDALAWLDDTIENHRLDADERPQQLFLTGDQIYADDVAGCLLHMLTGLASELLDFEEAVPMSGGAAGAGGARVALRGLPPLRRGRLVAEVAKFSTTAGASHLLGFGEFAAMYLAAWSPRVWRHLATRDELFVGVPADQREARHLTDFETKFVTAEAWRTADARAESDGRPSSADDRESVAAFALTVPKVARVLANCSTYMIFDDHEITDDWNISAAWRVRVLTSPLGRAALRNGLMAYAAFQASGNEPGAWAATPAAGAQPTPEVLLLDRAVTLLADAAAPTVAHENDVDDSLGLTSPTAVPKVRFHCTVDGPRHRVAILDTRTRRTYDSAIRHSPPKLVGTSLDAMLPAGPLSDGRELLFVVSPAPVLFPRIFDVLIQPAAAAIFDLKTHMLGTETFDPTAPTPSIVGSEAWDIEGWGAHEASFHAVLRRLASYPRVVILSGDVHFASSLVCDVWTKGDDASDSRILQCTASALKNEPSAEQRAVLRGQRSAQRLLQGPPLERLGWDGAHGVVLPPAAPLSPGRRGRLLRSPTFVPAAGWPSGTTLDGTKPIDVRYRIAVLRDERPATELGIGAPTPPPLPAWNAADPIAVYTQIAAAHQQLLIADLDPVRLMVFRSTVGLVSFAATSPGEHAATHAIMSPVGDGTTGSAFTAHTVDLARTAAAAPPTLTTGS